jgi:hypothetical protein
MKSWRRPAAGFPTLIVLALLVGCGGSAPDDSSGGSTSEDSTASVEPSGETQATFADPSEEPTGPEPPQPSRKQPAIKNASLPVGGNAATDGTRQCADVNWLGKKPIPDGVTVSVTSVGLDPPGVFRLDQEACDSDPGPCVGVRWEADNVSPCQVGVSQVTAGEGDVQLIVKGTVTCRELADCENLVGPGDGSQIAFSPEDLPPTDESPPGSPTDSPTDSTSDSPADSPTDSTPDSPPDSPTG